MQWNNGMECNGMMEWKMPELENKESSNPFRFVLTEGQRSKRPLSKTNYLNDLADKTKHSVHLWP